MTRTHYRPREISERLDVPVRIVLGLIHSGELSASNVAAKANGRPRWRVAETDVEAFLRRRSSQPTAKPQRRNRKDSKVIQFF